MCVVSGFLQQDNEILSCLNYNNYFSDKRMLSAKAWLCSLWLSIAMFYLIVYCYVVCGWLLLCSIWLAIAMIYLVSYCYVLFG